MLPSGLSLSSCAHTVNSDLTESPNYSALNEDWSFAGLNSDVGAGRG